jgi:soluble lytic murein transglycosylase-like protein
MVSLGVAGAAVAAAPAAVEHASSAMSQASLQAIVHRVSSEHGIDPRLADAVVQVESAYDPAAVSRRGALGLMQLMPDTARRLDVEDPLDPEQNVRGGVREVARLIDQYSGNLALALAAYNAGEGAVERYRGVPPFAETRNYVTRIMTLYTGRPYTLPSLRISPVRMFRDTSGRVVITNDPPEVGGTAGGGQRAEARRTLQGGFGTR